MFRHTTVLLEEAIQGLQIRPDGIYVDCTLGGAGHSKAILDKLHGGTLIGIDQDDRALAAASAKLVSPHNDVHIVKSNFAQLDDVLDDLGIDRVDGILFDLGVSSPQLDDVDRGFSYQYEAPLDMRMDQSTDFTAAELVNTWSEGDLVRILFEYGEESFARKIARNIVEKREQARIETTVQLAEIIKEAIPAAARRTGGHPAKRSFQAIRIAVNRELDVFAHAIERAIERLAPLGRIAVISFHSLEDRLTKEAFLARAKGCTCPPDFPVCTCHKTPQLRILTRKPILASAQELAVNRRSRSAKLRIAEKI